MEYFITVSLIGLISGIFGTSIGGLMAFFIKDASNRFLGFILEFPAGLMTAVVCCELIPEAMKMGDAYLTFTGVVVGVLTIIFIEGFLKKLTFKKSSKGNDSLLRAGILMSIGIALHNFPEGFAVGSGFGASASLGMTITAVIFIHDIPEGVAMAVPMRAGGFSKAKAFLLTMLSGVPMGIGALFGAMLGEISKQFISICLGFAAGAMLYVVFGELIPESKKLYRGRLSSMGNVLGILCGIIVSFIG